MKCNIIKQTSFFQAYNFITSISKKEESSLVEAAAGVFLSKLKNKLMLIYLLKYSKFVHKKINVSYYLYYDFFVGLKLT